VLSQLCLAGLLCAWREVLILRQQINTAKNRDRVADVYRLSKAKQSNEERSLPLTVH
jgi:hypothetical protein